MSPSTEKSASQAIQEIEILLGNRIIVYTADRSLGPWDILPMYKLLAKLGHQEKLAVIIQSIGGFADDAFKMANVIHEFANHVTFVVPSHAKSAATLLCLSGNLILMGPISELGPTNPMMSVDERLIVPTMPEPLGSEPKNKEPRRRQMAAHALRDFLTVSGVLKADGQGYNPEVLSAYIAKGILNPFLLGDFERSIKMAIQYAENLLTKYMFAGKEDAEAIAKAAAQRLCEGYYDHNYPIDRQEARRSLQLHVENMTDDLWQHSSELMLV